MKQISTELLEFLQNADNNTLRTADLYTFELINGSYLYYTSADFDITYKNNNYLCDNIGIKRGEISWLSGLSTDNLVIEFYPSDNDFIGDVEFSEALRIGMFDGAKMRLDMAFYADGWNNSPLVLETLFTGNVDVETVESNYIKIEVKSLIELLNFKFPPDIYQASCSYSLYGAGCGVNKADFSETKNTLANSTKKIIKCNLAQVAGYYDQGVIIFNNGPNLNIKRSIKQHTDGQLILNIPLPFTPVVNNSFTVSAGCNKTIEHCTNKFGNKKNTNACPGIPDPDTTL